MDLDSFKKKYEKVKVEENHNNVPSKPMLSVCIQTYQHVDYIKECLDSILMQKTNFEFEILLGEDNSSDGTREICIDYANRFPNKIRLFQHYRKNNISIDGSPTGRFNFMYNIYSSKGKYIAFCEGDDYWTDPLKLQKQVDFLENNLEYSACFTDAEIINDEKKNTSRTYINKSPGNKIDFNKVLHAGGGIFPTASLVFRNKVLKYPSFMLKANSGDWALALLLTSKGYMGFLNYITCVYRKHSGGVFTAIENNKDVRTRINQNSIDFLKELNLHLNYKKNKQIKKRISDLAKKILMRKPLKEIFTINNINYFKLLTMRDFLSLLKHNFIL